MKRVAIILGSPYPENSNAYLRGVSADVNNYKRFLMSSAGGAWQDNEIHTGIHIAKSKARIIQSLCANADIAVIVYSGHGFMRYGENFLNINPKECLNFSELVTTAKRQITIIDACRTDYPYEDFEGIGGPGIYFDNTRPDISRALYDFYINQSPVGSYTIFSSSANQASQDTEDGGRFSVSLLTEISRWSFNKAGLCMPVDTAFMRVQNQLNNEFTMQIPDAYYTGLEIPNFPLAISTRAYIDRFGLPEAKTKTIPPNSKNSKSAVGLIFGVAAIGIGIACLSK